MINIRNIEIDRIYSEYKYENIPEYDTMFLKGIEFCNERHTLSNYVYNKQRSKKLIENKGFKLIYLNMYGVYSHKCQYTSEQDGRHYRLIEALHANVVLNIINLFC